MTTTKLNFSEGIKSLDKVLNEIEALCFNSDFIKATAKTCEQIGISAKEWNENKMPILMKFAANIVLEKY
jgi:hypothetical protein